MKNLAGEVLYTLVEICAFKSLLPELCVPSANIHFCRDCVTNMYLDIYCVFFLMGTQSNL